MAAEKDNMLTQKAVCLSGGAVAIALLWYADFTDIVLTYVLPIAFVGGGIYFGVLMSITKGRKYEIPEKENMANVANVILQKMVEMHQNFHPCEKRTVISLNTDAAIQEIMDLVIRDYIMNWYSELATDKERFPHMVEDEMWNVIEKLSDRLKSMDMVQFMSKDVVSTLHKHFQDIREANVKPEPGQDTPKFLLHPWLSSEETELDFLRTVADVMLVHLLPEQYARVQSVRHLLREILACTMLKPTIDLMCDPDYINQTIYNWLDYREKLAWEHKSTYCYASTYETFMEMIEKCSDLEHLKQMRYNIISEIIQATAIQNLKRMKGEDIEKEYNPKSTMKGDLLRARNLTRYINQLTKCKQYCEKRIYQQGGPDYKSYTTTSEEDRKMPGRRVLSFAVIMQTEGARNYFFKYLKKTNDDALLRFWAAVENMKHTPKKQWHKQAGDMYDMFLAHPGCLLRLHFDKSLTKRMEAFMKGNMGPDAFHEAQDNVYKTLEEQFYPSFILSDLYHQYMSSTEQSPHAASLPVSGLHNSSPDGSSPVKNVSTESEQISQHCAYAQGKLEGIEEKTDNKSQALQALKASQKHDPKILKLREEMEGEIEKLKQERRQLESHIERTDLWTTHLGEWKAHIYNSQVMEEEGKKVGYFVIVVHLPGVLHKKPLSGTDTQGWIISRRMEDFLALHKKLIQIKPILKTQDLSCLKLKQKNIIEERLKAMKESVENYLITILQDDHLCQSETVFAFFSPSPEHLKQAPNVKSRGKFSLPGLFKSLPANRKEDSTDSDEELIFAETAESATKARDSIAGPFYQLIGEVFEVKGVFKYFRKTFIAFVRTTTGKSVNREMQSTISWLFSEPMIIYYLHLFKDSYWPDGKLSSPRPPRSDEDKIKTRFLAKEKCIKNIPDAVKNLVGDDNAKRGAVKMFEASQEQRLNRHLFYNILMLLLYELFPEINDYDKDNQKSSPATPPKQDTESVLNAS